MMCIQKSRFSILICLVCLLFGGAECEKETMPLTEHGKLPKITKTGANTFGCLIDQIAFVPHSPWKLFGPNIPSKESTYVYGDIPGTYNFSIDIYHDGVSNSKNMDFDIKNVELEQKIYEISDINVPGCFAVEYAIAYSDIYKTSSTVKGEINIIRFDQGEKIVSGTFWFDAINQDGKIVQVREGRFDLKFNQ